MYKYIHIALRIISGIILVVLLYSVTYWRRAIRITIDQEKEHNGGMIEYHFQYKDGRTSYLLEEKGRYNVGDKVWLIQNSPQSVQKHEWIVWFIGQFLVLLAFVLFILHILGYISLLSFFIAVVMFFLTNQTIYR